MPRVLVGTSGYNYPGMARHVLSREVQHRRRCSRSTPSASRRSRSTTRSTGCRPRSCSRVGGGHARRVHVHAEGAAPDHARLEAAALRGADCRPSAGSPATLGPKLGVAALPAAADVQEGRRRPASFVELLPDGTRAAFEFRHASGSTPTIFDVLRARNLALCVADSEKMSTPVEMTADYAYFRLRDEGYQPADIERWAHGDRALPASRMRSSTSSTKSTASDPVRQAADRRSARNYPLTGAPPACIPR